jgi:two-component system, NarL family, nitrate/nitrite response regulator NarL
MRKMTNVLIVTTTRLMSDLIQTACKNQPDLNVVGRVTNKAQALAEKNRCDVMLVSYDVPDALDLISTIGPRSLPVTVTVGVPNVESLILRFLEAGAAGCIRDQDSSDELVRIIRRAAAQQNALPADLYPLVLKRVSALANEQRSGITDGTENDKNLTRREREILELISQGRGNREIAQQLTIELGTTKNHVHNILDKLNVKSRRDAAVYYSLGLL